MWVKHSKSQAPSLQMTNRPLNGRGYGHVKAKFHYASWFKAGSS